AGTRCTSGASQRAARRRILAARDTRRRAPGRLRLLDATHAQVRHRGDHARARDAVDEVALAPVHLFLDQPVDVGVESREALVEVARELQVAHDLRVEALAG